MIPIHKPPAQEWLPHPQGVPLAFLRLIPLLISCHHEPPAPEAPAISVHCVQPKRESIDETVPLRGRVEPPPGGDLPVASQVAGRVVQIAVHEGQRIANGDVVANVDDTASRDALRQAEASLAQARANEVNANATLERTRALVARGIAARQELDDAIARADAAQAAVTSANATVDLARRTLGRVLVRSSFEGVVTRVWRGPGALVDGTAATPIVQLAADRKREFVAEATEQELFAIQPGQAVRVVLNAIESPFSGSIRARASALDPTTGLGTVRAMLESDEATMPVVGAFGHMVVTTAHREGVLVLPSTVLRGAIADGADVVVCKSGKAEVHPVRVGWRDEARFEVVEGVSAEDHVAVDHVLGLETDTPITEVP